MVNGILVVYFTLIRPLVCYIRPELVKLFNAEIKVLLEGKESMPLTSNIVRCMKDWVSAAAASSSRGGKSGCASARHCKLL